MAESPDARRSHIILDALDLETGEACKIQISHRRMQAVSRRGMALASECAFIVPHILLNPKTAFEGIRLDEDEDKFEGGVGWRCYCGIPLHGYRPDGSETAPFADEVYLVFINNERVAYNWRWEKCDPDDPRLPIDHEKRFKRRLK